MSDSHYIPGKQKEQPLPIEILAGQAVTQEMTPIEKMIPLEASIDTPPDTSATSPKFQKSEIELTQRRSRKMINQKQTSAKMGQLLKQVKKNEVEIHEMRKSIKSLDRMESMALRTNQQLMKQLRLQLFQLRKQMTRIQIEFRRMRTVPTPGLRTRKARLSGGRTTRKLRHKERIPIIQARIKSLKRTRIRSASK
jgi:hypothetical protein